MTSKFFPALRFTKIFYGKNLLNPDFLFKKNEGQNLLFLFVKKPSELMFILFGDNSLSLKTNNFPSENKKSNSALIRDQKPTDQKEDEV